MTQPHIAILDFGSQYMHLISRRIRQMGVLTKIYPTDVNAHDLHDAWGVILSGGPQSVNEQKLAYDPGVLDLPVPVLGLCYGHQLLAYHYGGIVTSGHESEYGYATVHVKDKASIFKGLGDDENVWMSHWDSVTRVPEGWSVIGSTDTASVSAMANDELKRYGLQFHVEVHHTQHGMEMLRNFVFEICGAQQNWSMEEYMQQLQQDIVAQVGTRNVFLLVSGGVDSSVAFALLEKILGKQRVYGLHIDTGFLRTNESAQVAEALTRAGFDTLHVVDASAEFLSAVEGVTDPEEKRKRIGRMFLDVQRREFAELRFNTDEWLLGQGTIYPDTIESGGTAASDKIKTHHNRVDEVVEMINKGLVVEPLAQLYKDEVRELGEQLGLPRELLDRWPFPGPGLAIRALCVDGVAAPIAEQDEMQAQMTKLTAPHGLAGRILPVRSVGVQGDQRSYQHPALLYRGATAGDWNWEWEMLAKLSVQITNGLAGVNRVVWYVGGKGNIDAMQLKRTTLTRDRIDVLRAADDVMDRVVRKHALVDQIWQFPVVLLPLSFSGGGAGLRVDGESIVLRPIESQEAMTVNFYQMDKNILHELVTELLQIAGIDAVFYDITNKPPGTIEWE